MALEELFDRKFVLAFQYIGTWEYIWRGALYPMQFCFSLGYIKWRPKGRGCKVENEQKGLSSSEVGSQLPVDRSAWIVHSEDSLPK
jgi:hypothetical protein